MCSTATRRRSTACRSRSSEGAIVAIVGANGAGKTSLIRTIAGMKRPARGAIRYRGADIAGLPSYKVCNLGIGQVAEGRQMFPDPDGARKISTWARCCRARARQGARTASACWRCFRACSERVRPGGGHAVGRRAADAGDRPLPDGRAGPGDVRRALARACACAWCRTCSQTIRDLNRDGLTCVLVEQNVAVSLKLASRAYVLENGRITLSRNGRGIARRRPGAASLSGM